MADRVRRQVECGIDVVTDGEMSKVMFIDYVKDRLGGYEEDDAPKSQPASWKAEIDMFPEYYVEYMNKYSSTVAKRKTIVANRPDHLHRPGPAADRHRQPQSCGGRTRRDGDLHAVQRPVWIR